MKRKSKIYELIGRATAKAFEYIAVGSMFAGFILVALNNMTVYR